MENEEKKVKKEGKPKKIKEKKVKPEKIDKKVKKAKEVSSEAKKRFGLIARILIVALIPMVIIVVFAGLNTRQMASTVSEKLNQHELNSMTYAVESMLDNMSDREYNFKNGELYKGKVCLTKDEAFFDAMRNETDIDITLIAGKTRILTSLVDTKTGERMVGTDIDDKAYKKILKDGSYFSNKLVINGVSYSVYYELIDDSIPGQEIIAFTGIKNSVSRSIYITFMYSSMAFQFVIAVIGALIIVLLIMAIVKSINKAVTNIDQVAVGNLNFEIENKLTSRTDEVGNIARSLRDLIGNLVTIVRNIHNSSDSLDVFSTKFKNNFESINNSISNINVAVEEIANGATNQANETQNVNTEITDMGHAIDSTTESIATLTDSTNNMKSQNAQVNSTLNDLVEISDRTKVSIDEVQKQTDITNQSAEEISQAINLITEIADQTNLLSLNASIEAARAGEHGRGFAVVADEIRQLADQSSASAERISQIVTDLIKNSNTSVKTMESVLKDVHAQDSMLDATKKAFDRLNTEVNNVVVAIDDITQQVSAIDDVKVRVLGSVESLAAIAQENAASTEETSASMFELGEIVNECNESTEELISLSKDLKENANKFVI